VSRRVRKRARLAFVASVVVVACGVTRAPQAIRTNHPSPTPPPTRVFELAIWPNDSLVDVRLTPLVGAQLDTIVAETRATRIEQAWCVSDFLLYRERGRRVITLLRMERSPNVSHADSLHIWSSRRLCDDDYAPGIHSHILWADGWLYFPSPTDLETAAERNAPFNLLISAGEGQLPRLTVYALRGETTPK
jgi:hypothetical protein